MSFDAICADLESACFHPDLPTHFVVPTYSVESPDSAANPGEGTESFFMVPGTGGVAAVGPGDPGYHGGHWAVYVVNWNVAQYPLTSYEAIMAAHTAGHIRITRNAAADFLCPIRGQ